MSTILSPIVGFRFFAFERWRGQLYFLSVTLFHAQRKKNTLVDVLSFLGVEFSRWGPVEEELACIRKHLDQQSISLAPMPQVRDLVN